MSGECNARGYERVYEVELAHVRESLAELKERVGRLEVMLARGVLLLVANLVGVVMTLTEQYLAR